ncbi:hypothetical protein MMC26_003167 [Xylographa opegraphella]|nr:hypothetical protein [Xylographa opegraphella]
MSDHPTSPLPSGAEHHSEERLRAQRSKTSLQSQRSRTSAHSDESTPLLSRNGRENQHDPVSPAASSLLSLQDEGPNAGKPKRTWPTIVALSILSAVVLVILGLGFAAPAVVREYAKEAAVFEPTDLSIDSFTTSGVKARIRGNFQLDASKVQKKPVRDLGRAGTWIARAVESRPSYVKVTLPEYDGILLGTALVPSLLVDIRDGHTTYVDFTADLEPGDADGIRDIANDWLEGRLDQLRVQGKADVVLKSGIFSLGTQTFAETLEFKAKDIPTIPQYNITRLNFHEVNLPDSQTGMAVDVSITMNNDYPVTFTVPPLGFDILVPGCVPEGDFILLANATTGEIQVSPNQDLNVTVSGIIRQLPDTLTTVCPDKKTSPLDVLLGDYIHGIDSTIFVRGAEGPVGDTPSWISELIKSVIVPLPFPGHPFDNLMRDFSMANVHLSLPDPFAEPGSPEAQPQISATVKALVNLPKEMNFPISVSHVRADAEVFYHDRKLGLLDLHKWQEANSTQVEAHGDGQPGLMVESVVEKAPLNITDDDVFSEIVQALLFGGKNVVLGVKAKVDVETETTLGKFIIREIPAQGKVPIKPLSGNGISSFAPKVGELRILDTTRTTFLIEAKVNMTNPTNYSATVPYVNINMLSNGTILGFAVTRNVKVVPGQNDNILVIATWEPARLGGQKGLDVGRELLSQYISGYNTTLTLRTHNGTIPMHPNLGEALSSIEIEIPTPKLDPPKNPNHPDWDEDDRDDKAPRFIDDATMHLFTSTATFMLLSPLHYSTIFVTHINATAYYNHTDPVGEIIYELPFAVPPGATTSPRLPVDWSLDSVGYQAVKQALGGTLKLDAKATVGIRLGEWEERVWFTGGGIGARIKI